MAIQHDLFAFLERRVRLAASLVACRSPGAPPSRAGRIFPLPPGPQHGTLNGAESANFSSHLGSVEMSKSYGIDMPSFTTIPRPKICVLFTRSQLPQFP